MILPVAVCSGCKLEILMPQDTTRKSVKTLLSVVVALYAEVFEENGNMDVVSAAVPPLIVPMSTIEKKGFGKNMTAPDEAPEAVAKTVVPCK